MLYWPSFRSEKKGPNNSHPFLVFYKIVKLYIITCVVCLCVQKAQLTQTTRGVGGKWNVVFFGKKSKRSARNWPLHSNPAMVSECYCYSRVEVGERDLSSHLPILYCIFCVFFCYFFTMIILSLTQIGGTLTMWMYFLEANKALWIRREWKRQIITLYTNIWNNITYLY